MSSGIRAQLIYDLRIPVDLHSGGGILIPVLLNPKTMNLTKKLLVKNLEHDRPVVERLVSENIAGKLDSYLRRYKE